MEHFTQSELPDIHEVEIRLMGRWGKTVRVNGEQARLIAELWKRLPPGNEKRCHLPAHELRFLAANRLICTTTVCWKCNNVRGTAGGRWISFEFDGQAELSQQLLAKIQQLNPGPLEI